MTARRVAVLGLLVVVFAAAVAQGQTPRRGGVLNARLGEDPPAERPDDPA